MKAALLQYAASQDKAASLKCAISMSRQAIEADAQLIALPEMFNFRGDTRDKGLLAAAAETIPGPSSNTFIALARKHNVSFLLGSLIEKAGGRGVYNTSVFIDSRGKIAAKYRKINLFDAVIGDKMIREADCFRPGKKPVTVKIGEFRAGLSICYDLRFPELYRKYARLGVEILTVPSCFTRKTGEAHWETLLRARAIENLSYVLAPGQVGTDARGIQAHGHSMAVSPWGEIIARGSADKQQVVFAQIDIREIRQARSRLPGIIK